MLYHAVLCHSVLCQAVLCHAVLCHAVLCHPVLCFAALPVACIVCNAIQTPIALHMRRLAGSEPFASLSLAIL